MKIDFKDLQINLDSKMKSPHKENQENSNHTPEFIEPFVLTEEENEAVNTQKTRLKKKIKKIKVSEN